VGRTSRNANRTSHPSHTRARGAGDAFEADVFAWDAQFKSVVFRRQPQHTFQKADYRVVPAAAIKDAKVRACVHACARVHGTARHARACARAATVGGHACRRGSVHRRQDGGALFRARECVTPAHLACSPHRHVCARSQDLGATPDVVPAVRDAGPEEGAHRIAAAVEAHGRRKATRGGDGVTEEAQFVFDFIHRQ
jgi:hypothetical protein